MSESERAADVQRSPDAIRQPVAPTAAMVDIATRWHEEMLRFCGLRMSRYFELSSRLWECRNPNDLLRLQTGFLEKMVADYSEETDLVCRQLLNAQKQAVSETAGTPAPSYEAAILQAQRDAAKIIDLARDQAARIVEEATARASATATAEGPARRDKRNKSATA
jgi:hypothetical protein